MRSFLAASLLALACAFTVEAKDDWFEARSDHFTIVSNGGEGRAKDVLEDLEQLRRLITEILPAQRVDGSKPVVFYLFKSEQSMRPFQPTVGGEREEWGWMYRPSWLQNVALVQGYGNSDGVRNLVFGEYMQVLEGYNDERYPLWLSNGLSLFYGNTEISRKQASIGMMRREYRSVLGQFREVPIRELFAVDHSSDWYRDLNKRSLFDAQCWALVHYLLIGKARENGAERLGQYLAMVRQGQDPLRAFEEIMGKPHEEIDRDVGNYIRKSIALYMKVKLPPLEMDKDFQITELDDAEAKAHEGLLFTVTGYYDEAERSLAASIEAKPDQVTAYEAMALLRDRQGRSDDVASWTERAIQKGSTNPHVHLQRAQLVVDSHGGAASELSEEDLGPVLESLRFAISEAPELTEPVRIFGYLALFHEESREEGLQILMDGLERQPGESSLVFMLGQLRAREGAYAAARALFKELLDRQLDSRFEASVRKQYEYVDAQMKLEAQRIAEAARAAEVDAGTNDVDSAPQATVDGPDEVSQTTPGVPRVGPEVLVVRGKLARFDCTGGHRFIVEAEGVTYALNIVDLSRVLIRENGEVAGPRDFYCGPLDARVIASYIPAPAGSGKTTRSGELVAIDFVGK